MAYNTVEEIKGLLLLETENQTMTNEEIQNYINDANVEMVSEIRRAIEIDSFVATQRGTNTFYPFFNMAQVTSVRVRSTSSSFVELDESEYKLVRNNDGIEVDDLRTGDQVEVYSIPPNYKMLERALAIVAIKTRFNPFKNNTVDPLYATWEEKRKSFLRILKSKFGVSKYSG